MLVMVAAFSRFIAAVMLPSRQAMDLVAGMWLLLSVTAPAPHELWGRRNHFRASAGG